MVGACAAIAFDNVQRLAVEVTRAVEPCPVVEAGDIHDQRFTLPASPRPSHPGVDRRILGFRHAHDPAGAGKFVGYQDRVARLDDLKRMRHVCRAGHTRQVALDLGVERQPVVGVLLLLLRGPRLVRDVVAFDHTGAGRDAERGAKRDQRTLSCRMILDIPVGGVHRLPDPVQVGVAVAGSRCLVLGRRV